MNNILEGLIWFWVPASLVICNDIFAYIWGITFGRTPLIKLSPKKTVEGFVGAFFSTIVFGLVWGTLFMRSDYMICPAQNLGVNAFSGVHCTPNPIFIWREWELWGPAKIALSTLVRKLFHWYFQNQILVLNFCWYRVVRSPDHDYPVCTLPGASSRHVVLRVSRRALWRVLCVGLQACIRHQRLWA